MKCKRLFLNVRSYVHAISLWLHLVYPSIFNADKIVILFLVSATSLKKKLLQFSDFMFARKMYSGYGKQSHFDRSSVLCAKAPPDEGQRQQQRQGSSQPALVLISTNLAKLMVLLILQKNNSIHVLWKPISKENMESFIVFICNFTLVSCAYF